MATFWEYSKPVLKTLERLFVPKIRLSVRSILGTYLAICAAMWLAQDFLIYPGAFIIRVTEEHAISDGRSEGLVPFYDHGAFMGFTGDPHADVEKPIGTMIVFHANGACAFHRACYVDALQRRGFRVILYEFPGYGGRGGSPNEVQIVNEGRALVQEQIDAGKGPIYLLGESIGSGPAAEIAGLEKDRVKGLILVTPFHSLVGLAWSYYPLLPVPLMVRDRYESATNLQNYPGPVFILQAEHDYVVRAWSTNRLFDSLPGKKLRVICPGAEHSTWPSESDASWWDQAVSFITQK